MRFGFIKFPWFIKKDEQMLLGFFTFMYHLLFAFLFSIFFSFCDFRFKRSLSHIYCAQAQNVIPIWTDAGTMDEQIYKYIFSPYMCVYILLAYYTANTHRDMVIRFPYTILCFLVVHHTLQMNCKCVYIAMTAFNI